MDDVNSKNGTYNPPEPSVGDYTHAIFRAGLSTIPVIGGAAVELFAVVVTPPMESRRNEWMKMVGESISRLETESGIKPEDLQNNDAFIDAVLVASQIAVRTSQEEKIEALRNAVINSALPNPPEESLQQFFLHLIDIFTVWHLRILYLFQNPPKWAEENSHKFPDLFSGGLDAILESAYPELHANQGFYNQVWRDLFSNGLLNTESPHGMMTGHGLLQKRTTSLGDQFLSFIENKNDNVTNI